MKRYRRKVIRLQSENDHLRAVLDIIAGDARKMKTELDELKSAQQENENGQD
jgi:hypothetical protein